MTTTQSHTSGLELLRAREKVIRESIDKIETLSWGFQAQVVEKARVHLVYLLMDSWKRKLTSKRAIEKQLERSVKACFNEMMEKYHQWCIVSNRRNRSGGDVSQQLTQMLLLLTVFGEIDLVRTQNNACFLLFHLAMKLIRNAKNDKAPIVIADVVIREAKFAYQLIKITFDKGKMNEEFFDWDDLNDLCWTPGFVKMFLKRSDVSGFQNAFHMDQYPFLTRRIAGDPILHEEQALADKELQHFASKWKTYIDRTGGIFGWKGYLTFFLHFYQPVYYQAICTLVALAWLFDFKYFERVEGGGFELHYISIGVSALPLVFIFMYAILRLLLRSWTKPKFSHAHRFTIPRRDSNKATFERWFSTCGLFDFIRGNILHWFHKRHFASTLLLLGLTISNIVVLRYVIFEVVRRITKYNTQLAQDLIYGRVILTQSEIPNVVIMFVCLGLFLLSMVPVCVILPPTLFSIWSSVFGFIKGWKVGANRMKTWDDLKHHLLTTRTLKHFNKKMLLNCSYNHESVEQKFAIVWNSLIDDFYQNHQVSKLEKDKLSYKLSDNSRIFGNPEVGNPPISSEVRYHLIRFLNNLYAPMPYKNVRVIDMKRISIITPVYREKIYYSWNELVETNNNSTSFLKCLLTKYKHDWNNFKEKEFPPGKRMRKVVEYIEEKVLSGVDLNQTSFKEFSTHYIEKTIRKWASQRFQPVSRTINGFTKVPKALMILLRMQNPELSEKEAAEIVKQKFVYLLGAQLYDRSSWKEATGYNRLSERAKRENDQEYSEYVEGLNDLCQTVGDSILRIAFVKQNIEEKKYKGVLKCYQSGVPKTLYEIDVFGDFSKLGQGKPTNQGFISQFFDASFAQAVDCNMDSTLSQSFFLPNVLKEFDQDYRVKIIGFPEFVFTKSWSQFGYAAAFTEKVFGTMIQRVWSMIGLRFHYGHPDILRGLFVMFTTGLSKLSYISEDIFLGFDTALNSGRTMQVEYFEVGKARDVDVVTTTKFNRKIAMGAAQLVCSRYPHAVLTSSLFSFSDKLLFCYSSVAHYSNTLFTILSIFLLYSTRLPILLAVTVLTKYVDLDPNENIYVELERITFNTFMTSLDLYLFQIGMILSVPGLIYLMGERGLVRGTVRYIQKFVIFLVYSMFQMMNTGISFHAGLKEPAKYIASGRGTGLQHRTGREVWNIFKSTHFYPAGIMLILAAVGLGIGGSHLYLVFHGLLISIWLLSPLISLPLLPTIAKSIAPWRSGYTENPTYVESTEVSSIMHGQRAEWFARKELKLFERKLWHAYHYYNPQSDNTVKQMAKSLVTIVQTKGLYESIISRPQVSRISNKIELNRELSCKFSNLGLNLEELCTSCSNILFMNRLSNNSSTEVMKVQFALAQFDMLVYYKNTLETTTHELHKVDEILLEASVSGINAQTIDRCMLILCGLGASIVTKNRGRFDKFVYLYEHGLRDNLMKNRDVFKMIINKAFQVTTEYLEQSRRQYSLYLSEVEKNKTMNLQCVPSDGRFELMKHIQSSMNFAKRLTENRSSCDHIQATRFSSVDQRSQILVSAAFANDDGSPILEQVLPLQVEGKSELISHLNEYVKQEVLCDKFLELECSCWDLFEVLDADPTMHIASVADDSHFEVVALE